MATIPERFLPVEPVVRQLLRENFPELNTNPGSAIHDVFVLPASIIYQGIRDRARVIQRNQSLDNYNLMLPEELDRLASNFLITRRQGTQATGTQRIYFDDVQEVSVETSAVFTSTTGLIFRPTTAVRRTSVELAANQDPSGEFFVDVPIISDTVGSLARATAGQIDRVTGVVGATRTTNLTDLVGGDDQESNSELFVRIKAAVTNRELVKKDGIAATLQETFPSVKSVLVLGFGDEGQERDTVETFVSIDTLVPTSFGQKVNLPLDANGEVLWTSTIANQQSSPEGGFVGAIYDLTGLDYSSIEASFDGKTTQRIALQEGNRVRLTSADDPDAINNDYLITRVEEVPTEFEGEVRKVIRLDRPFIDTTPVGDILDKIEYQLLGPVYTDAFHIGGKIDVYIDTISEQEREVIVSAVPAVSADSDVGEIPLTEAAVDDFGNSLFANSVGFISPVISIAKVELLDFITDEVLRELVPGTEFNIVRKAQREKFTAIDSDVLVVQGTEEVIDPVTNLPTGEFLPLYVGQRLRVTYATNPDVTTVQAFVDSSSQRDVTKDILVLPPTIVTADVAFTYSGDVEAETVQEIVRNYINQLTFEEPLCSSDIITVLSHFGVSKVNLPIRLSARRDGGNGTTLFTEDETQLNLSQGEVFRADSSLSIIKV